MQISNKFYFIALIFDMKCIDINQFLRISDNVMKVILNANKGNSNNFKQ